MKSGIIQRLFKFPVSFLPVALVFLYSGQIMADRPWPIITFTCDAAKNEVKLKNEVKWGEAGKNFSFNAEHGTYNPWDLVLFKEQAGKQRLSEKSRLILNCQLGKNKYRFVIRPKIFNSDFGAKCGDRLSVVVSVYKDDNRMLRDKAMEAFCNGNAPVLRGIKVKGGASKAKLYEVPRSRFY